MAHTLAPAWDARSTSFPTGAIAMGGAEVSRFALTIVDASAPVFTRARARAAAAGRAM